MTLRLITFGLEKLFGMTIVHAQWNQLISKYLLKQSDTLETHYRHTENVREEVWCWKNYCRQNNSFFFHLAIFFYLFLFIYLFIFCNSWLLGDGAAEIVHAWRKHLHSNCYQILILCRFIKDILNMCMKKFATGKKNHLWQNHCHFNFAIYVCPYVCPYWFPNHIQPEISIHFNTLLFSTHKAVIVITLRGRGGGCDLISTAYWHFLFWM